jgi:hypothetical protein
MRKFPQVATAIFVFLSAGALAAGEKGLMHCFAFTPIESATDAEWKAFFAASDQMPKKIDVVKSVWYGRLKDPFAVYGVDAEARKKFTAGEQKATGEVVRRIRQWGMCMWLKDEASLKTYDEHPYHKEWGAAYEKVRVPGTTTFDIIGQ